MFKITGLATLATLLLAGCISDSPLRRDTDHPAKRAPEGPIQADFYQLFCEAVERDRSQFGACDDYIVRPRTSPAASIRAANTGEPSRTTLVFIPGIFGQCVSEIVTPFSEDYPRLRDAGYDIVVVPVEGRSSSERNAEIIDHELASRVESNRQMIVLGYSKGATDFMVALAAHPEAEWVSRTRAFVSVAGVVRGTPLADKYSDLYERLLQNIPFSTCPPGDGGALKSLTTIERASWLANHVLPSNIHYYSIAAVTEHSTVNPLLRLFYDKLADEGLPNDGQVAPESTELPSGIWLALLKGDHWSITLPFESSSDVRAIPFAMHNHFPRQALIDTILLEIGSTEPVP